MIKILEIIGFVLIGGTVFSYLGMIGHEYRWPVFLVALLEPLQLLFIVKRLDKEKTNHSFSSAQVYLFR